MPGHEHGPRGPDPERREVERGRRVPVRRERDGDGPVAGRRLDLRRRVKLARVFAPASPMTLVVDIEGSGGFTDIQSAIDAARHGDTCS